MIVTTETITINEFAIAGIAVKTINNGQSRNDMRVLWDKFYSDNIVGQFEGDVSKDVYCVYSDYETDYTGYYTALIGCKVDQMRPIPDGFIRIFVPAQKYIVYNLAGKCPQNVFEAWEQIWLSEVDRKYAVDFDRYSFGAKDFADTEVKIYLSVR